MVKTNTMAQIEWRRIGKKAAEEAIKKAIELVVIFIVAGVAYKLIFVAVPAVMVGSIVARIAKIKLLE